MVRLVARPALLGSFLGLAIGLCEAARLYFVPTPPLLVRHVIWVVAPLVDLTVGGLIGLVFGLVTVGLERAPKVIIKLLAVGAGAVAAVSACAVVLVISPVRAGRPGPPPAWWLFFVVFCGVVVACYGAWRRCSQPPFHTQDGPSVKVPSIALLASVMILLSGVAVFAVGHRFSASFVKVEASSRGSLGKPNFVFISIDTVRPDHLSLYGYSRQTTPNLDRWARQGVVFDNAIASSPWTLPSHASMMTGLLPHQHGANWLSAVDTGRWTLAEALKASGYETAGFAANFYLEPGFGIAQGFDAYDDVSAFVRGNLTATWVGDRLLAPLYYDFIEPDRFDRVGARELNRSMLRWYRQRSGNPYFLFVNYFDAHEPHIAPAPYDQRFGRISRELIEKSHRFMSGETSPGARPEELSDQERQSLVNGYDNSLAYLDSQLDELLRPVASQPDSANTFVVIASDHGQAFGEHGLYGHGNNVYRELIHVPLIILGPGVPAGRRINDTVTTRRLFDTVLDLALGKEPFVDNSLRRYWEPGFRPALDDDLAISELAPPKSGELSYISLTTPEW